MPRSVVLQESVSKYPERVSPHLTLNADDRRKILEIWISPPSARSETTAA